MTITDIWTKFGTELKYHTINTPEWPNSHKLEFRKNVNKLGLDKDILQQITREDAPWPRGDDHMTKSRNRKLVRVTSSNKGVKHMCVDLSDYNIYLNQIWHWTQIPQSTRRDGQIHKLKIQDGGGRHLEFQRNVNNSGLDTDIYTKFYGKMYRGHAEMTTWPKVETGR